jgi:hypothetical protein
MGQLILGTLGDKKLAFLRNTFTKKLPKHLPTHTQEEYNIKGFFSLKPYTPTRFEPTIFLSFGGDDDHFVTPQGYNIQFIRFTLIYDC